MTNPETPPTSREEAVQRLMGLADEYAENNNPWPEPRQTNAARAAFEAALIRELAAQPVPNGASITNDFIEHSHRDYGAVYFCTSDVLDRIRQLEAAAAQPAVGAAQPEPATYSREWFIAAAERAGEFVRANPVLAAADAKAAVGVPADPLQGAADWLREALNEPTVADIQSRLLIGYNRAKRLFDAPPSPAVGVVLASEPLAWLFQHDETGRMAFCPNDGVNTVASFVAANPRLHYVSALYSRATHPSAPDPWRQATDEALVAGGLDCLGPDESPAAAVNRLISWEVTTALDPAISERAQALIERGRVSAPPAGYALVPLKKIRTAYTQAKLAADCIVGFARDNPGKMCGWLDDACSAADIAAEELKLLATADERALSAAPSSAQARDLIIGRNGSFDELVTPLYTRAAAVPDGGAESAWQHMDAVRQFLEDTARTNSKDRDDWAEDVDIAINMLVRPSASTPAAPAIPGQRITTALAHPGCERLRDWASTGPVQRAAVELFADLIAAAAPVVPEPLARDAARYRWLRDKADFMRVPEGSPQVCLTDEWGCIVSLMPSAYPRGAVLDRAIDAILAATPAPQEKNHG